LRRGVQIAGNGMYNTSSLEC